MDGPGRCRVESRSGEDGGKGASPPLVVALPLVTPQPINAGRAVSLTALGSLSKSKLAGEKTRRLDCSVDIRMSVDAHRRGIRH